MKRLRFHSPFFTSIALALAVLLLAALTNGFNLHCETEAAAETAEGDDASGREAWFYEQRAYPANSIPHAARWHAIEQLEQEQQRRKHELALLNTEASTALAQPAWTPLGPLPIAQGQTFGTPHVSVAGRVLAIALDPGYNGTSNQTVYLGAATGGVWRSRDNGANWAPLADDQPSLSIGALAIDPNNANVIYAGTGEGNAGSRHGYYGAGLLKSTNGGASWTQIVGPISATDPKQPAFLNAGFSRILIDPTASATVYVCTTPGVTNAASSFVGDDAPLGQRGIWKSSDGGQTWQNLDPTGTNGGNSVSDAALDPLNHNRVWVAVYRVGIYRSTAGGQVGSWTKLTNGLPTSGFSKITLATGPPLAPSTNSTLYAAFAASDRSLLGIFKSTDNGANWNQLVNPQDRCQCDYDMAVAVDPADANIVYYGTAENSANNAGTFFRSRDGGQTWTDLSTGTGTGGLHADHHAIVISHANRNILFAGNDGGIWRTDTATSNSISWTSLNQTLSITQFQAVALHPTNPNILLGGTQDNGTVRYDGNPAWFHSANGDGGFTLIDQSNPLVMYHTFFDVSGANGGTAAIGPQVSFDGGNTWTSRRCNACAPQVGNFNPTDRVDFYSPMALHPGFTGANGNVVYYGTQRLYRTANFGATWIGLGPSSDGFGQDLSKGSGRISAIAAYPTLGSGNPRAELVWVGTSDGNVQATVTAGALDKAVWFNLTKAPLPNRFVTDISLNPNDPQVAAVAFSGFNVNTPGALGHVFLTTDGGTTWTNISGNLPDTPVNTVVIDPLLVNTFYVGTDIGVFQTSNGGTSWEPLQNGLPRVPIFMLRYQATTRSLIAATHGRGMYRLKLPPAFVTISAASFDLGATASEAIVAGFGASLATTTVAANSLPLPTQLAGTTVRVRDSAGVERLAPLFFVAPQQINYEIPPGTVNGPALVTVTSGDGSVSNGTAQINNVAPGLFTANANGQGVAAAIAVRVKADGSQTIEAVVRFDAATNKYVSVPIDLGPPSETVVLVLFGTGWRFRSSQAAVAVTIGGTQATVLFAGAQGTLAGLDQCNVLLPRTLAGRGEVELTLSADNQQANPVRVSFK